MLKFLRKKGVMKVLLWTTAVVIILCFGILSNAGLLQNRNPGSPNYAGKVFGKKVSLDEFENNYHYTLIQAQLQYGQNFNQIFPQLNLEQQTWDRIILLKEAAREHIKVSDQEVIEEIRKNPLFHNQKTRTFNQKTYQQILRQGFRINSRTYEEGIRDDLKIRRLFELATFNVSVTDDEVLERYKEDHETIRVSYVLFPTEAQLEHASYDEIQAKNFFLDHKRDFLQPPMVNVFSITVPFDPDQDDSKTTAYEKVYTVLTALHSGTDLSDAAKAHQLEVKESGFFDLQNPDPNLGWPLETFQMLARMKLGQYSDILSTENSYLIIQLHKARPAYYPPYDEVQEQVKTAYLRYEASQLALKAAEAALPDFQQGESFTETAQRLGLSVYTTPDFLFGQYLPIVGVSPDFHQSAFALSADTPLSGAVMTKKGAAILHLDERIAIDNQKYEDDKDSFGQQLLMQKKMQVFQQDLIQKLRSEAELMDLVSQKKQN